jgi:hypothetical protein
LTLITQGDKNDGMATRGRKLDRATVNKVVTLARTAGIRGAARQLNLDRNTIRKYAHGAPPKEPKRRSP